MALREAITAEVERLAAIKEAANTAAKGAVAQGAAPSGQVPRTNLGLMWLSPAPSHEGQGPQQALQAYRPRCALQGHVGPAGGVPPTRKVGRGPHPKARRAGPSAAAARKKKIQKKTNKKKTL